MKTRIIPSTVRLTPKAMAALITLESKRPGNSRSALVENALSEATTLCERVPISAEEFNHVGYIHRYLLEVAETHTKGPKKNESDARQIGLAAKTAALLLKRVFMEAKGRIAIAKP